MPLTFLSCKVSLTWVPPTFGILPLILGDVLVGSTILVDPEDGLTMTITAPLLPPGRPWTLLVMQKRPGNRLRTLEARWWPCTAVHLTPLFCLVPRTILRVPPMLSLRVLTRPGPLPSLWP